jgi:tol-pal system protein YbgF
MGVRARALAVLLALGAVSGGCYTKRMQRMETSLDVLHTQVDSASTVNTTALAQMKRDLAEQRELLLSLKAGSNAGSKELVDQIEEISAKLDDMVNRMSGVGSGSSSSARAPGDTARVVSASSGDAEAMYEQSAKDFTQGRFELALAGFRSLLSQYPQHELSDNALYGVGESFYALAKYDSAQVAYHQVEDRYPRGDRVPAALYKLGMTYVKLGDKAEARSTFTRLRQKFPRSGEAKLAEERLKELR